MSKTGALFIALASAQPGVALPVWIQLLPAGTARPADDREPWHVQPEQVVAASASKLPLAIDADHATDLLPKGSAVPAYGWIEELKAHGPSNEPGVWGRVDWTDLGTKALAGRSYRFISPVFFHDKDTRDVRTVIRASLTNDPALSLKALAAREGETKTETSMSGFAKIAAVLALAATATEDQILAAITAQGETLKATAARLNTLAEAGGLTGIKSIGDNEVVALAAKLKAPAAKVDDSQYVPIAKFDELQKQLAAVQSGLAEKDATAKVEAAIAARKLVPAQRDWAIGYASRDPKGFDEMIGKQPVMLENGRIAKDAVAEGELTPEQKALCANMGLTEEAFKKELAANGKKEAA